jgi:predicted lipoprotein with Yx(FWY)xxD motif
MVIRSWALILVTALVFAGAVGRQAMGADFTLNVASAMVGGKSQQILVGTKGMSLYYLSSDTKAASACTGGCASAWPPLLSASAPMAPASVTGKLAIVKTANGSQVSYNGHLLYSFGDDSKPGDVQGEGVHGPQNGVWHVATPGVKPLAMQLR